MKKIVLSMVAALFVGSVAIAADAENADKATVDTSKNPITGTKTTTKKYKKKLKNEKGEKQDVEMTEKTKEKKDGTTETSTDVEADTTTKK